MKGVVNIEDKTKLNKMVYDNKYKKEHYKRVTVLVPLSNERVLNQLNKVGSKSAYILDLIEKDMKKND